MENNRGCLIYLVICFILSIIIYKVQNTTFLDAFFASIGLVFGFIILFSIIVIPIVAIIKSIKEQGWNIKNNKNFQSALYWVWYFIVILMIIAYFDCIKYETMYDYHDILYWLIPISSFIFLLFLPVIILAFVENNKLEKQQKDYDELKKQCKEYEQLLLEHKIIKYSDDDN